MSLLDETDEFKLRGTRSSHSRIAPAPEGAREPTRAAGSIIDRVVCKIQQTEFGSFTIHYEQRCICPQISAKLTRSNDADRGHPGRHAIQLGIFHGAERPFGSASAANTWASFNRIVSPTA